METGTLKHSSRSTLGDLIEPRSPVSYFVERPFLLQQMSQALIDVGYTTDAPTRTLALYGEGGMGKSEMARAFVQAYPSFFSKVWWITCGDSINSLEFGESVRALAVDLGLPLIQKEGPLEMFSRVCDHLEGMTWEQPYLIILDQFFEGGEVLRLPKHGGMVLATTRSPEAFPAGMTQVVIPPFRPDESERLLGEEGEEIAPFFHHSPLALALFASFAKSHNISAPELLSQVQAKQEGGLSRLSPQEKALKALVTVMMESLEKENPQLIKLASFFASLCPDHIPLELGDDYLSSSGGELQQQLIRSGLFSSVGGGAVTLHRSIRKFLHPMSRGKLELFQEIGRFMVSHIDKLMQDEDRQSQIADVFAHALSCATLQPEGDETFEMLLRLAEVSKVKNFYHADVVVWELVLIKLQREAKGEPSLDVANAYVNLGMRWDTIRVYSKAIHCYKQALEIQKLAYGDVHPDLAVTWNNLAFAFEASGHLSEAELAYEKALELWKQGFKEDEDHIKVLTGKLEAIREKGSR